MKTDESQNPEVRSRISDITSSIKSCASVFFIFCVSLFTFVPLAFGAEEAHGGIWEDYRWKLLNFAVLIVVLVWAAKKPLKDYLKKRTEVIEKTLKEATEARELAQKALADVEERLKLKDKEIDEILSRSQITAANEKELLIKQGEQMREKILEQAKNNIDYELRLAKESIKSEAAEIALELAEKKLKDKLTKEEQIRLIEESLKRMETKN
jgi:F-type H+-transporting ATPase subunit b